MTYWIESWRADPIARQVADRHYNRQKVGAKQFVPPGRCLVLRSRVGNAFWITSWPFAQYVKHAWPGAFVCSAFRNEGKELSSAMIVEAVQLTRWWAWKEIGCLEPEHGFISFVDRKHTRRKRDPGRCFLKAGFVNVGETKAGLVALQIPPARLVYYPPMETQKA